MSIDDKTQAWRRRLPHLQRLDREYFLTLTTINRRILAPRARTSILETIVACHLVSISIYVAVVMPDHVHMIMSVYPDWSLNQVIRFIKSRTRRALKIGPLWQREYFDRIVRHDDNLRKKAEYILNNPVRAGLAATPDEYPWIWRVWIEGKKSAAQECGAPKSS